MAQIVINEISQNYTYNIGTNSYATVAMPISSCWGPGFFEPVSYIGIPEGSDYTEVYDQMLDQTAWYRFPATQAGLESFVSTFRGPVSNFRLAKDYSYQMAMTLLTAGYDVLVCRLSCGACADSKVDPDISGSEFISDMQLRAKYPGTFGNNLQVILKPVSYRARVEGDRIETKYYWNMITYVVDSSGARNAVENLVFVAQLENANDNLLYWKEVESQFVSILSIGNLNDTDVAESVLTSKDKYCRFLFENGTDRITGEGIDFIDASGVHATVGNATKSLTQARYEKYDLLESSDYYNAVSEKFTSGSPTEFKDITSAQILYSKEWIYTMLVGPGKDVDGVFDLLKDKLSYNPNRIITSGWDDQDFLFLTDEDELLPIDKFSISPLHIQVLKTAYYSRCATGYIDIPHSLSRKGVYLTEGERLGYAQMLSEYTPSDIALENNGPLFSTHCALFAPWGRYQYVGMGKQFEACPAFQALMIQRAQILNQAIQYEWALPTNRKHNLRLGKLAYNVPKKLLDQWQKLEGVGVNAITAIPDLGINIWGNSTLFEVPPATYQALANLSTRLLVNAVEDVAYRVGISITFQYNNEQAYNKFYAGVTPILDTMKNVGAIDDYYVRMAADINGLDQVNANTVIGKIYLVINGVINDIYIDLIALPPGTDLNQYRQ